MLLCDYNKEDRPSSNKTSVGLRYMLTNFDYVRFYIFHSYLQFQKTFFKDGSDIIRIQARILHRWQDSRLKWQPDEYEGIHSIYIPSDLIWIPLLYLNETDFDEDLASCKPINCLVVHDSWVACSFPCHQTVYCARNSEEWPFDETNCSFTYVSGLYGSTDVVFDSDSLTATLNSNSSNDWQMTQGQMIAFDLQPNFLKFIFVVKRIYVSVFKHVFIPGYVLIFLTLSILTMKEGSLIRSIVSGLNIYLHFDLIDHTWWLWVYWLTCFMLDSPKKSYRIPSDSAELPRIMKYFVMMLALATILLIETIVLKLLTQPNKKPPTWIRSFSKLLSTNELSKYFVYSPLDEIVDSYVVADETVTVRQIAKESKGCWRIFCRFIDRTFLLAFVFALSLYNGK